MITFMNAAVLVIALLGASGATGRPVAATAGRGSAAEGCSPQQVHVALADGPDELRVSWSTEAADCPSTVDYYCGGGGGGEHEAQPPLWSAAGSQQVLRNADMCTSPARDWPYPDRHLHTAVLRGLRPGGRYFYQVAGAAEAVAFRAPPPRAASSRLRAVVYGDMGESEHRVAKSPGASATAAAVAAEAGGLDLVLHVGDVSYANGRLEVWDAFMRQVEPYARSVAYMVAAGNHEQDWEPDREARSRRGSDQGGGKGDEPEDGDRQQRDASGEGEEPYYVGNDSGGECGVGLAARFVMPGGRLAAGEAQGPHDNSSSANDSDSGSASGSTSGAASDAEWWPPWRRPRPNPPFWYDFVAGPVAFVVLSTEHSVEEDSPQRLWLDAALRAVDRCASPWLVVGMHRPMYVPYPHKSNRVVAEQLRGSLEGALSGAGVDLVVSGHVHSYHRTCAVLGGRCVGGAGGGVTHVVVGSAGKRLSSIDRYDQPEWLEQAIMRFGYGRLTADAARALRFEFVGSEDGEVLDWVELQRPKADRTGCCSPPGDALQRPGHASGGDAATAEL